MTDGVTCIGGLAADVLARPVREMPTPGHLALVGEMLLAPGGCAQNCACALARLGITARLIGRVGDDDLGAYLMRALATRRVDTTGLLEVRGAGTSATMVLVSSSGERSFFHAIGATAALGPADVNWDLVAQSRILFIGQFGLLGAFDHAAPEVLRRARELGTLTALDTVWDATHRLSAKVMPCLPYVDYFLPSYSEARMITGLDDPAAMAREFHQQGVGVVAIKLGEDGCYLSDGHGGEWSVPAFDVQPIDATGAGDAWCAGFIAGILQRLDLAAAGRLGNAVGACCVLALGTYDGIRTMEETLAFMASASQRSVRKQRPRRQRSAQRGQGG